MAADLTGVQLHPSSGLVYALGTALTEAASISGESAWCTVAALQLMMHQLGTRLEWRG